MERVEVMMKDGKLSEDAADHVFVADKP